MSTMLKLATFLIIFNISIYISINMIKVDNGDGEFKTISSDFEVFSIKGDLIGRFFSSNMSTYANNMGKDEWSGDPPKLNTIYSTVPSQLSGEALGTNIVTFLDALGIIYSFLVTLINIAICPIAILFSNKIHPIFGLLIGVPITITYFISIIMFIRGQSDWAS